MPRNQILVIRGGAVGDFIVTLPVLAALRERFSASRLDVLGYPGVAQLAVTAGLADGLRSIESRALAGFFAGRGELDREWCAYFNQFAVIVSYLYDPDENFQTNVRRVSEAQFLAGPHRPPEDGARHATELLLEPLERLAIFGADPVPRLNLAPARGALGPGRWLALHPGSGSERKNWALDRWIELVTRLLAETEVRLLLVGGEADGPRLDALGGRLPPERGQIWRGRPLGELAPVLATCQAFVGHDSGITHLAAALGLPGIALWGPSNPVVWQPRSERFQRLFTPAGLAGLEVATVWAALQPWLR